MRRSRGPPSPSSPYRALSHHQQSANPAGHQSQDPVSLIRSFNVESNPTRPMRPSPLTASTIPDMPLEMVDRMRSFPLFMSAPETFLAAIGSHLRPQIHAAQDHILSEGDDARAMYWLVRGVVAVTSRDGEAVYAELTPGAFFGEIGVLMDIPRTATIIARTKCLLVVLKKEDLHAELPRYPEMEKAIRQEAQERLAILNKKRQESSSSAASDAVAPKTAREAAPGEVATGEKGSFKKEGGAVNSKKRKSPSPGIIEDPAIGGSALGSGYVNVRRTLKELPLFSTLPPDILHFLGLSAQPKSYPPFTDIICQGTPGNDIFFIVRGEAEVIHYWQSGSEEKDGFQSMPQPAVSRPRLKQGQYFGEVASLGLSPGRTATVRSITAVECLVIGGASLRELWKKCPPGIKSQVEETARKRYKSPDEDIEMGDMDTKTKSDTDDVPSTPTKQVLPEVTFTTPSKPASPAKDEAVTRQAADPDPFLSVDMENLRNRRRGSLAPPTPQISQTPQTPSSEGASPYLNGLRSQPIDSSPLKFSLTSPETDSEVPSKRARTLPRRPASAQKSPLPDDILIAVFWHLDIVELMRLRQMSTKWKDIVTMSPKLCTHIDLSAYNRKVTDHVLSNVLSPFIGSRPLSIDISNCFHISDEGFTSLWRTCGKNVKTWRMRSVWDVSANQILDMSENAKGLEEIDWSNCRKVGDNLLARVVGWVVPEPQPAHPANKVVISNSNHKTRSSKHHPHQTQQGAQNPNMPPPGTVIGCSKLKRLNLSYCKHITDRSMAHLAAHASNRLAALSLTRCTSITDAGFQTWAPFRFTQLTELCLADCTYLSDNAVIALVNAAKSLTHLDLSFCCALSDTATEVVALGLPNLKELRLAFCGSAVSDASLQCISLHLNDLEGLSVRGCVRVTGMGVNAVLDGCGRLAWLDVSQCKNLSNWLESGGISRWGFDERGGDGRNGATGKPPSSSSRPTSPTPEHKPSPCPSASPKTAASPVAGTRSPLSFRGPSLPSSPSPRPASRDGPKPVPGMIVDVGPGWVKGSNMRPMPSAGRGPIGMGLGIGLGMGFGLANRKAKKPIKFIVEKGTIGLR